MPKRATTELNPGQVIAQEFEPKKRQIGLYSLTLLKKITRICPTFSRCTNMRLKIVGMEVS